MTNSDPRLAMMAQVALSYGETLTSQRLMQDKLSFSEGVEILAQSPKFKELLPAALSAYTQNGERIGKVISGFGEFEHRSIVARELSDLLVDREKAAAAADALDKTEVHKQLDEIEKGRKRNRRSAQTWVVKNAIRGQSSLTDRFLREFQGDSENLLREFMTAEEKLRNNEVYEQIAEEIFGLYAQSKIKERTTGILTPGIERGDVELTKALREFAMKWESTPEEKWRSAIPQFISEGHYAWQGSSFADTVRRIGNLLDDGRLFVRTITERMNCPKVENKRLRDRDEYDEPKDVLESAERLKAANLPEEVYKAFYTEFSNISIVNFTKAILQEPVLAKIRALDKMGPHLGKAVIAYAACYEKPEDVLYVAEHILDVNRLGKSRPIYKELMHEGRYGKAAKRLRAFLPEGVDLRNLSKAGKNIVRMTGFNGDLEHMATFHKILAEHQDILAEIEENPLGIRFSHIYSYEKDTEKVRREYENFILSCI